MKKLIHEVKEKNGDVYQLYAELEKCYHPQGYHTLMFSTAWPGNKNPKLERTTTKIILSPDSLKNLQDLLKGAE